VLLAPVHLLWINLVTDSLPAMALGTEPAEKDIMQQRPRNPREGIFANGLGIGVLWQGVLIGLLTLGSYLLAYFEVHGNYGEEQTAAIATTMAFITLSMCEIFHSINMRSRIKSIFNIGSTNKFIIGSSILGFILTFGVVYIPGVNDLMNLVPLDWEYVLTAFGMAICIIPIVEIVKLVQRAILKGKNK
ncbi:MAG: cation transporting ATPase C-terminal domain-containing protein, partial [Oscillospiraceae bacterium]|nr:cation transporting ATPase C-terminal domain-containing protein [Oscillospiraceae bacterium]